MKKRYVSAILVPFWAFAFESLAQCVAVVNAGSDASISCPSNTQLQATIVSTYDFNTGLQGWTTANELFTIFGYTSISFAWAPQSHGNALNSLGIQNQGSLGAEHNWILSPALAFNDQFTLTFDSWSNNESGIFDREFVEYQLMADFPGQILLPA